MIRTVGQWLHEDGDLLLGLVLLGLAYAIALAARLGEESRRIDAVVRRPEIPDPPVDEWAAELDEAG